MGHITLFHPVFPTGHITLLLPIFIWDTSLFHPIFSWGTSLSFICFPWDTSLCFILFSHGIHHFFFIFPMGTSLSFILFFHGHITLFLLFFHGAHHFVSFFPSWGTSICLIFFPMEHITMSQPIYLWVFPHGTHHFVSSCLPIWFTTLSHNIGNDQFKHSSKFGLINNITDGQRQGKDTSSRPLLRTRSCAGPFGFGLDSPQPRHAQDSFIDSQIQRLK